LTAIASVAEMTGNFTLTLPIMLACGLASQLARQVTHGSIYTTKLLRRGIDIERPKAIGALRALTVEQVMQPLQAINGQPRTFNADTPATDAFDAVAWRRIVGPVTLSRRPQTLFVDEDLEQARRQLVVYGRDGLPVLTHDGQLQGWLTRADILSALTTKLATSEREIRAGAAATAAGSGSAPSTGPAPTRPLPGYELLEVRVQPDSPALGKTIGEVHWPAGSAVVAVTHGREVHAAAPELRLQPGERVLVLMPLREPAEITQTTPGSDG
jgi:CIC family chloride channel protein